MNERLKRKMTNLCVTRMDADKERKQDAVSFAKLRNNPLLRAFFALILAIFHIDLLRPDLS